VERVGRPESRERSRQLVEAEHGLIFLEGAERVRELALELLAVDGPHLNSVTGCVKVITCRSPAPAGRSRLVDDADLRAHLAARGHAWAATRTIDSTGPRWAELWGG